MPEPSELEKLYIDGDEMPLITMAVKDVHWHRCCRHRRAFMCGNPQDLCDRFTHLASCPLCDEEGYPE